MSIVVYKHGILQFINVYKMYCNRCCAELRWGDEVGTFFCLFTQIECNIVIFDHENKTVKLSQRAPVIIDELTERALKQKYALHWQPDSQNEFRGKAGIWFVHAGTNTNLPI